MVGRLPLREGGRIAARFAVPLVLPPDTELPDGTRPRIYIAPLESRADGWILGASLERAGIGPPAWSPSRRAGTPEAQVRDAFLGGASVLVPLSPPRSGPDRLARLLAWAQQAGVDVDLIPLEVLWGPVRRTPSAWSLLLGNPYEPPFWRRLLVPNGRVRVIAGAPGTLERLRGEASQGDDALSLSAYVRGQALKALSVTERHVFGDWYKVPRLVVEQIMNEPDFQNSIGEVGAELGLTRAESLRQAERGLRELATGHNVLYIELLRRFVRWMYTKVYDDEIDVEPGQLERLLELSRSTPLVFTPSHKSNFDHLVLFYLLTSSGFPPPHTAAGINMSFFPMSRVLPGTGAYFIRRSFANDPVYKECLRRFIEYLVQRRFHQEFFIEGGRSRAGKLLPPRYGMLNYVVDGVQRSHVDDVLFVPTAIAYDEVAEIGDYVREQLGEEKKGESFAFLVRMIRSLRSRDLGRVYIRFAEPISLRRHLERSEGEPLVVEKLAFQIANGINGVTPLTAAAALCSVFLGAGNRALTRGTLEDETQRLMDYALERGIPVGRELEQGAKVAVDTAVRALGASGVIEVYEGGIEPVYHVAPDQRHVASFYRNTTVHFFLARAIAALAEQASEQTDTLEQWALRLRDLLKFEFFWSDRAPFLNEVEREVTALALERNAGVPPMGAAGPRLVVDYLEGYWVVMRTLQTLRHGTDPVPERELLRRCLAIGRQLLLESRVAAPELLSTVSFRNALKLAENREAVRRERLGYVPANDDTLAALARELETLAQAARR
jgi:glycerol-3-phosphate O-acyltransferase